MAGLFTRGTLRRNWGLGPHGVTVSPEVYPPRPPLHRTGAPSLNLPPTHVAMNPADPKTWSRPVIRT